MPIIKFLCSFNRKGSNTRIKCNSQMLLGEFIVLLVALIFLTILTRNLIQKILEPLPTPTSTMLDNEAPLCTGNLLDKREHHYAQKADGSYDNSRLITKTGACHLKRYTQAEAVGCLDALYDHHLTEKSSINPYNVNLVNNSRKRLHIAFVGDSRIRQQFYNFLKLITDYDQMTEPNPLPFVYHGDMEVISNLLRLRITFQWQPLIDDTIFELTRMWATDDETDPPYLLVMSMALWHMLQSEGANHQLYQKKLKQLAPILDQLANVSQIIWLNLFPTVEFYGNINAPNTEIHTEKIHHYNLAIRRILGNHKSVRIWDSCNPLAEEYVRGCTFSQRIQYALNDPSDSFFNCNDYSHAGYSALSQSTQLLLNDICNNNRKYILRD